jgi:hypothetical protein
LLNYASSPLQVAARQFLYRADQRDSLDCGVHGDRSLLQHVYLSWVDGDRGFARSWPGGAPARRIATCGPALSLDMGFLSIELPVGIHHVRGFGDCLLS